MASKNIIEYKSLSADCFGFALGTSTGIRLYTTVKDTYVSKYSTNDGRIIVAEPIPKSNIIAVVGSIGASDFDECVVKLWDYYSCTVIGKIYGPSPVLRVKCSGSYIVIGYIDKISICSIVGTPIIAEYPSSGGIIAIRDEIVAYSRADCGTIGIYNCATSEHTIFKAHIHDISNLVVSYNKQFVVSTSLQGTILRIWSIPTGNKLFEFRLSLFSTRITSVAISQDNLMIAASSSGGYTQLYTINDKETDIKNTYSYVGGVTAAAIIMHRKYIDVTVGFRWYRNSNIIMINDDGTTSEYLITKSGVETKSEGVETHL